MIIWSWNFVCVQKAMLCTHVKSFRLKFSSAQEVQFQQYTNFEKMFWKTHEILVPVLRKLRGTVANIILPPQVLFHCREIYFTAATFILLPRDLFYYREFYFSTASFILLPRVLFCRSEFYFHQGWGEYYSGTRLPKMINMNILKTLHSSTDFPVLVLVCSVLTPALIFTTPSFMLLQVVKIKLAVVKIKLAAAK